jgi:D-alanyl-D-alanine carboxypeptidase/D-alanyl-D-alanine-endopeptidase (penicillin-binding protein 4)
MKRFLPALLLAALPLPLLAQRGAIGRIFTQEILRNPDFQHHFTGCLVYDPDAGKVLFAHQAECYFTPASNTKLYTLYAGLRLLGDSLPCFRYGYRNDTLFIEGMGDPTLLHPEFPGGQALAWLQAQPQALCLVERPASFSSQGPGWAWDDYLYRFACERAPLPVYGNFARVRIPAFESLPRFSPRLPGGQLQLHADSLRRISRPWDSNAFSYFPQSDTADYEEDIPLRWSWELAAALLSDTLGRPLGRVPARMAPPLPYLRRSFPADSLYRPMLQASDNFFAEQILVMAAQEQGLPGPDSLIRWLLAGELAALPDAPAWVDGSGVSRYNLFTPRDMAWLLARLDSLAGRERLAGLLPAGGVSGTLKKFYAGEAGPYVFAKTGTLSNQHCLSGYLRTRQGKWLIFSLMLNNYRQNPNVLKQGIEAFLRRLRDELGS